MTAGFAMTVRLRSNGWNWPVTAGSVGYLPRAPKLGIRGVIPNSGDSARLGSRSPLPQVGFCWGAPRFAFGHEIRTAALETSPRWACYRRVQRRTRRDSIPDR